MDPEQLLNEYFQGTIDPKQLEQLDQWLAKDRSLRKKFIAAATLDTAMREYAIENEIDANLSQTSTSHDAVQPRANWRTVAMGMASLAAVLLLVLRWWLPSSQPVAIAELLSSENAAWESTLPTAPGSALQPGLLRLKAGVATLRFRSGAEILLEAPADIELRTEMKCRLLHGASIIAVPPPAVGFVVETPNGYAVDHGTRFAVRVDRQSRQASFELVEGEISVHHSKTGRQARLVSQGENATIDDVGLTFGPEDKTESESAPEPRDQVVRLRTGDRFGSVLRRDNFRHKRISRETLSVKHTNSGKWDHRSFFTFDLSAVDAASIREARLKLNLVPSGRGLASRLPKTNRFGIYGVTKSAKQSWPEDCLWDQAPAPEDGELLGTFEVPRSVTRGTFGIHSEDLLRFIRERGATKVTFVLIRETPQIEGVGPGLTHMFASDKHPESVGPLLELVLDPS